jgi:Trk K+ transport system NAD-binding subunit
MNRLRRRAAGFVGVLAAVVASLTLVYRWSMATFEGETPTLARSLRFVVETMTTVGYGSEATWTSPAMDLVVTGMMITGVLFFFLSLPMLVVPMFEAALTSSPPTAVDLSDHVVLCGFSGRGEAFIEELSAWDADYVVVEADRDRATTLHDAGYRVVHGDPESADDLVAACAPGAKAVVADVDDETNASIALTCQEVAPAATVVAFAEDPDNAEYVRYAGADEVLTPRHLLGQSLAEKATSAVSTELGDVVQLDDDFDVAELPVQVDSEIAGVPLGDSGIRERTGVNIIGAWRDGVFDPTPAPTDVLEAGIILLVAGRSEQLERLKALTRTETRSHARGRVVVIGYGEVGTTVAGSLASAGVPYTVVDQVDDPAVDVVGDARKDGTLRETGVTGARAVIVALPDDTTTIFTTLVLRELDDTVEVAARAGDPGNVRKLYLAGADYVLSLSTVSGRMLAGVVLDEEVMTPDKQVDVVRCRAPALAGKSLADADVGSRTNATVIAVERNGDLLTDLDADFVLRGDDELVIAGSDDGINRFTELARG